MALKWIGNHEGSRSTCVMDMTINGDQQAWNDYRQRTQGACNSVPQVFVPALILDWSWSIGSTLICGGVTQLASWTSSTLHIQVPHTWEQPTTLLLLEWHVSCHALKYRSSTLANLILHVLLHWYMLNQNSVEESFEYIQTTLVLCFKFSYS